MLLFAHRTIVRAKWIIKVIMETAGDHCRHKYNARSTLLKLKTAIVMMIVLPYVSEHNKIIVLCVYYIYISLLFDIYK
jgi:hypothetical protein